MADLDLVAEELVTTSFLLKTLKRAFYKASVDEDGDLRVETEGPTLFVRIESNNTILKMFCIYTFTNTEMTREKLELANRLNDRVLSIRFAISESNPQLIVADCFLSFEGGFSDFQFISIIRRLARVVPYALKELDTRELLK